ncbi:MAG: hypothetical protein LBS74_00155 [Oscillospiraceae bacterium]|jgi:uncharacterized ion transporter superfamily protein YfcC|nr:hypothetical protein [Oscillospiraceae bacterium]
MKKVIPRIGKGIVVSCIIMAFFLLVWTMAGKYYYFGDYAGQFLLCCLVCVGLYLISGDPEEGLEYLAPKLRDLGRIVMTFIIFAFVFDWIVPTLWNVLVIAGFAAAAWLLFSLIIHSTKKAIKVSQAAKEAAEAEERPVKLELVEKSEDKTEDVKLAKAE